jgi:hypothetical protein
MRRIDSKGRVKTYPDHSDYAHRAEERAGITAFFDARYPRTINPEMEPVTCARLAACGEVLRTAWLADHPEWVPAWERYTGATK